MSKSALVVSVSASVSLFAEVVDSIQILLTSNPQSSRSNVNKDKMRESSNLLSWS